MEYTVDFFIAKFEQIPEDNWGIKDLSRGNKKCAYGQCGIDANLDNATNEGFALSALFMHEHPMFCFYLSWLPVQINDGTDSRYNQPTPKQRILAAHSTTTVLSGFIILCKHKKEAD